MYDNDEDRKKYKIRPFLKVTILKASTPDIVQIAIAKGFNEVNGLHVFTTIHDDMTMLDRACEVYAKWKNSTIDNMKSSKFESKRSQELHNLVTFSFSSILSHQHHLDHRIINGMIQYSSS
jgi:hypothetical protein